MELTPQLLTDEIDFRIAVRGYDRNEVDDFLERVAVAVGQLQSQLTKAATRARNAESRLAEFESGAPPKPAEAETPTEAAPEPAEVVPPVAAPKAPPAAPETVVSDDEALNEELRRTLVLAQRTADTAIREAHDEARSIIEQANETARQTRETVDAETSRTRDEARRRLVQEIAELEALRETMRHDTVVLDRYLGTERTRVRETIQVLRRLVDDPESFRPGAIPELSEEVTPEVVPDDEPTAAPAITSSGTVATTDSPVEETRPDVLPNRSDRQDVGEASQPPDSDAPSDSGDVVEADDEADSAPAMDQTERPLEVESEIPVSESSPAHNDAERDATADPSDTEQSTATSSDAERLGQLFDEADTTRDWRSAGPVREDQGPHTQPVAAARFEEESDEAFLAELRRAMDDDEPLGPESGS